MVTPPHDRLSGQRFIFRAGGGTLLLTLMVGALLHWFVVPRVDPDDRLLFAARCINIAALPLLASVWVVMRSRVWSGAHDPLLGQEDHRLRVHMRVLQNTLEQLVLFSAGAASCAANLPKEHLHLLITATIFFVVGRAVFWWGYLRPGFVLARAPGVAMTIAATFTLVLLGAGLSVRTFL